MPEMLVNGIFKWMDFVFCDYLLFDKNKEFCFFFFFF